MEISVNIYFILLKTRLNIAKLVAKNFINKEK